AAFGPAAIMPFAVAYGAGNGMITIAKGTLPLAIFGPAGYGLRTGILSAPARLALSAAPFLFGLLLDRIGLLAVLLTVGLNLASLKQPEPPGGWREALDMLPLLKTVMAMRPRTVADAPCQEIVLEGADIDLARLPIQTCWPDEPAPLITWPLVVTKGPGGRRE